jgi:hypothetical protein
MGGKEMDKRFKAMSSYPGLRHFEKGIMSVTQWTGMEHKEMEKVLLGITIGGVPSCLSRWYDHFSTSYTYLSSSTAVPHLHNDTINGNLFEDLS